MIGHLYKTRTTLQAKNGACLYKFYMQPCGPMKKIVTFQAKADDLDRWREALAKEDKTLSAICRAALNRFADRVEAKQQTEGKDHAD